MNIPVGYPHASTDEQLRATLAALSVELGQGGYDINQMMQLSPLVAAGQSEILARATQSLDRSTQGMLASSDRLVRLTWALIALTVVLVVVSVALLARDKSENKGPLRRSSASSDLVPARATIASGL